MPIGDSSVAVITGAASGIGRALAVKFAKQRVAGIVISDINEAELGETAAIVESLRVPVLAFPCDVSKLEQVSAFHDAAVEHFGRVTHLVNNAGVGLIGRFDQLSIDDFEWIMSINFWGVVYGCKAFLPTLLEQDSAHIVNMSSVFGLIAPEEQSAYCASKFAVRGFTESLRHELAETNVGVSCVHPGGIKTNIVRNSRVGEHTPEEWKQQGTKFFDRVAKTTSDEAAAAIIDGINAKNARILIGKDARSISHFSRLFPKNYLKVIERLNGHKMSLRKK